MLNFILQVDKLLHLFNLQSEISLHDMKLLPLLLIFASIFYFVFLAKIKLKRKTSILCLSKTNPKLSYSACNSSTLDGY